MTSKDYKNLDLSAYFIGPKAENGDIYKSILNDLADEHFGWRQNHVTEDKASISDDEKRTDNFQNAVSNMKNVLEEVSRRLRNGSIPWNSAGRYWGHMNNETLMPAILAYNFAILWNGNNTAWEGSPAGSLLEKEVGDDLAHIMGFTDKGWGHITADGTLANLESVWYARNIKSIPLAVKEVCPDLVKDKSEWELLNMTVEEILDLLDSCGDKKNEVKSRSAKSGKNIQKLGKIFIPQTMHYSWPKSIDVSGIGEDNLVSVPVDDHYHTDINELEKLIRKYTDQHIPVLGVVAVVGSTEEGAVDNVDKIVALRKKLSKEGINFYLHVDAAYGGYGRTVYLDSEGNFIPYKDLKKQFKDNNIAVDHNPFLKKEVYESYKAIQEADSVTIDPHKTGYIPYDAGGIAIKDTRMKDLLTYEAPYAFQDDKRVPASIGLFTLEGSKPAAAAAAVWAAHRTIPLNVTGYGRLVEHTGEAAERFYEFLKSLEFTVNGKTIKVHPLMDPDFNMVNWVYKIDGDNSLKDMDKLTHEFFAYTSVSKGGNLYNLDFVSSHTVFKKDTYGNSPKHFIESLGIDGNQWEEYGQLNIMRASCMTPFVWNEEQFNYWAPRIKKAMNGVLQKIGKEENILS